MRRLPILLALVLPAAASAQSLPYWQDVNVTSVNAETQRTEAVWYGDRADALKKGFRESENYVDLNGTWDFKYFDDYREMERFLDSALKGSARNDNTNPVISSEVEKSAWDKIKVPGNWEVQGFGVPIYVNQPYDFCPRDPQPPTLPDVFPAAIYHRTFTVPELWIHLALQL